MRPLLAVFFALTSIVANTQDLQQKKDDLSKQAPQMNDGYVPTGYLFDSLFVVSDLFLHKNRSLAKAIISAKMIYDSKDSITFYVKTGKAVVLNGLVHLPEKANYIRVDHCRAGKVELLSAKGLKEKYNIQNVNGAYLIFCE
jgi:hypothetical protein